MTVNPDHTTETAPGAAEARSSQRPLVSVLMPVLNEEAKVEATIASVLAQEGVDVEVLVVDGRSGDRTAEIVRRIAGSDPRVRLLDNPKVIIPAALNIALDAARGEYMARIDGHADAPTGFLAAGVARLQTDPQLGGVGGLREGWSDKPTGRAIGLVLGSPFGIGDSVTHFGTEYQLTDHASFGVYRTHVAREVGGWDESLLVNEDVDFDHRVLAAGYTIGFDPAMHLHWHVREDIPSLFRQYRRYGRGKAAMIRKNGRAALRPRHLAAPVAVTGTAALAALATRHPKLAAAAYSPYVAGVAAASVQAWRGRDTSRPVTAAAIPAAFAAVHYGWGIGFIEGYVLGRQPYRASGSETTRRS